MVENKSQRELQEMLMQLESGKRQLEALSKQAKAMEAALVEASATIDVLKTLKDTSEGTELLMNLGSNTFLKVSLKDKDHVLVGVGAATSIEKKLPVAVKLLEEKKKMIQESLEGMQKTSMELSGRLSDLNAAAESMFHQQQHSH